MKVASYKRRDREIYSIADMVNKCKEDGRKVHYKLYDDRVGCNIYIGINKCITFHITYGKNGILTLHYMVYFPSATLINNVLSVAYESELSEELMKEVIFVIYLLNMGEDYNVVARTFLKRMNGLELEHIEDNSNDIDYNEINHLIF